MWQQWLLFCSSAIHYELHTKAEGQSWHQPVPEPSWEPLWGHREGSIPRTVRVTEGIMLELAISFSLHLSPVSGKVRTWAGD